MTVEQMQSCGKNRYPSERVAIRSALRSSRRGGTPLRVYRCDRCHGWHLTKMAVWHPSYGPKATKVALA